MNDNKDIQSLIPSKLAWLRATVSAIPMVGGALDHLLFDKADEIRARNVEQAITAIENRLRQIPETAIDKNWFSSEEALAMFRELVDKIQFEPDRKKRDSLANVVAVSGTTALSSDSRKLSVLDHLNRLTYVQMKMLSILSKLPHNKREIGTEIVQSVNALWADQIVQAVQNNPSGQFWVGQLNIGLELEVLEALNVVRRIQLISGNESAFAVTDLGKEAAKYFAAANG